MIYNEPLTEEKIEEWMKSFELPFDSWQMPHERFKTEKVQFRFPKSKKSRIRKKWAKNPKNFRDARKPIYGNPIWMDMVRKPSYLDFEKEVLNKPPNEYFFRVGTQLYRPDDDSIIRSNFI